jgi:hypothetical protein
LIGILYFMYGHLKAFKSRDMYRVLF